MPKQRVILPILGKKQSPIPETNVNNIAGNRVARNLEDHFVMTMDEILAKLEACMATLDQMASRDCDKRTTLAPNRSGVYVSMVTVDGKPILPPLMTPDKRVEMARYKAEAIERERKRAERKERALIAKVEQIVNSYEESRKSVGSKESSPVVASNKSPERVQQAPVLADGESKSALSEVTTNRGAYSPLKYMETDDGEEEWNVRPATPWRRAKQSNKPRKQIAANFGSTAPSQPITSTMRMDAMGQDLVRGNTPDVSAISLASSRAVSSLSNISPVGPAKASLPPSVSSAQDIETQPDTSHGELSNSGHGEVHTGTSVPESKQELERRTPDADPQDIKKNTKDHTSMHFSGSFEPELAQVEDKDTSISRLSPIPKENNVRSESECVLASLGSQSTSSSSNSALNQTVIDLSQMSLTKHPEGQITKSADTSPRDEHNEETKRQGTQAAATPAETNEPQDEQEHRVSDIVTSAQYLSDTESYLSLLGEYSQLPMPGSRRQQGAGLANGNGKETFFSDPTLTGSVNNQAEPEDSGTHEERRDGQNKVIDAENKVQDVKASEDVGASERSVDTSEYFGSSLGTLAQSCTLPISLSSINSESTLQGVEEMWERTSQDVTPMGIEEGASPITDDPKGVAVATRNEQKDVATGLSGGTKVAITEGQTFTGMVRVAPVGQENKIPSSESSAPAEHSPKAASASVSGMPNQSNPDQQGQLAGQIAGSKSGPEHLKEADRRSGVKVESKFPATPKIQHVRRSSYTLDFPSPALLDAEARREAPHIGTVDFVSRADGNIGQKVSTYDTGYHDGLDVEGKQEANVAIPSVGIDAKVSEDAKTSASNATDIQESEELSCELKDLKLDDVTESKVLHIQLSCLERMQERLQRQHQEQMKELMNQQMQELSLLESEMEGIRRQATESALGHVEERPMHKPVEESSVHDNGAQEDHPPNVGALGSSKQSSASQPLQNETKDKELPSQTNPPPSPGSGRKRRYDGTATGEGLVEVPPSYISPSSLSGSGHSPTHSFVQSSANSMIQSVTKKLTPQDSLDSNHSSGLVEVPPSYIGSGGYRKPVQRSPPRINSPANSAQRSTTPGAPSASPSVLVTMTNAMALSSHHSSSDGTSLNTPASLAAVSAAPFGRDSGNVSSSRIDSPGRLSSWLAQQANTSQDLTVQGYMDSFFLSNSHSEDTENTSQPVPDLQPSSPNFRPWTITPSLQMDVRFDKMSARVKGYLTRALLRTPKVTAIVKTIKDTQQFLSQFQAETPVKRGKLSDQDTKLAHRVLAQLRAAQFELDDIFHNYPVHQRMAILHAAREQERENFFNKKVLPPSVGDKAKPLSAATRKAMERRQQLAKDLDQIQSGPKRQKLAPQSQRPKSAAEMRVLRPLQSARSPGRPATALPPKTSKLHSINQQSHNLKKTDVLRKPFPSKPVMVSRHPTTKSVKSPSRPTSRTSSRVTATRVTSGPALHPQARKVATGQPVRSSGQHARSPGRQQAGAQSQMHKTKNVRRSLYPASTVTAGRKTTPMQRKQAEVRKP